MDTDVWLFYLTFPIVLNFGEVFLFVDGNFLTVYSIFSSIHSIFLTNYVRFPTRKGFAYL